MQVSETPREKQTMFQNWFEHKRNFLKYRMKMIGQQRYTDQPFPQHLYYDPMEKLIFMTV